MDTSFTHIRPRFKISVPKSEEIVLEKFKKLIPQLPDNVSGRISGDHVIFDIQGAEMHFWSPQLNFRIEKDETNGQKTILAGIIGPKPSVWTLFMFIYFSIGTLGFFISCYGISKWVVGEFSPLTGALPLAVLIMLTAYKAGKYGETLSKNQIELLKNIAQKALET